MTNEQHIENLKKLRSFHNGSYGASINAGINALKHEQALGEAFNIALLYGKEKGMEAIDKALYQIGMDGIKEQEIKALEQELCEDAISRDAACDIVGDIRDCISVEGYWAILERLKKLPPVKPQEPKTGYWIPTYGNVKCSVCGSVKDSRKVGKATHYCDFCGAKMVESQERRDKE